MQCVLSSTLGKDAVRTYSNPVFHEVEMMEATIKINTGRLKELTLEDTQELFKALDADESGRLEYSEIAQYLREVVVPPCTPAQIRMIYELTDQAHDMSVTCEELFRALTAGPVMEHLQHRFVDNVMRRKLSGPIVTISRQLMVERVRWSVERDDAFKTLPFSLCLLLIFIIVVTTHLNIWERQQVERGVARWLEGEASPSAVASADDMWTWMATSGLPDVLGHCGRGSDGFDVCRLGTRGVLVGDVELRKQEGDSYDQLRLLQQPVAKAHLAASPGDYVGAALKQLNSLRNVSWAGPHVNAFGLAFTSYVQKATMFALVTVETTFDGFGRVKPSIKCQAVPARQYPDEPGMMIFLMVVDFVYIGLLTYTMISEVKDMLNILRAQGLWDGFKAYGGLWNAVDWFNIVMGLLSTAIWILCILYTRVQSMRDLLGGDDDKLLVAPMGLSSEDMETLNTDLLQVVRLYNYLRITMCLMTVTIMLKFFKAFQANARLEIVTNTLVRGGNDIFHFLVVFTAIFIGFAVTGHILFGNDLYAFRSMASTIDAVFMLMMGEFTWYLESADKLEVGLNSGMHHAILAMWYWSFMVFVLLILINMLLAIVLKHYADLEQEIGKDPNVQTLFAQTMQFFSNKKASKGFMALPNVLIKLEDDGLSCHPSEEVTSQTLAGAFPQMKDEQVAMLVKWLQREAANRTSAEEEDQAVVRLKHMGNRVNSLTQDLSSLKLNLELALSKLKHGPSPQVPLGIESADLDFRRRVSSRMATSGSASDFGEAMDRRPSSPRRQSSHVSSYPADSGDTLEQSMTATSRLINQQLANISWYISSQAQSLASVASTKAKDSALREEEQERFLAANRMLREVELSSAI